MFACTDHTRGQQQVVPGSSEDMRTYYAKELEDWDCLGSKGI